MASNHSESFFFLGNSFLDKLSETFMSLLGISLSKSKEEVIEQKLKSRKLLLPTLLLQDAAVREKTSPSLYQKGFYLLLQSFLFFQRPIFLFGERARA